MKRQEDWQWTEHAVSYLSFHLRQTTPTSISCSLPRFAIPVSFPRPSFDPSNELLTLSRALPLSSQARVDALQMTAVTKKVPVGRLSPHQWSPDFASWALRFLSKRHLSCIGCVLRYRESKNSFAPKFLTEQSRYNTNLEKMEKHPPFC